jgi:hypothetical protein
MTIRILVLLLSVAVTDVASADKFKLVHSDISNIATPELAVSMLIADVSALPEEDRLHQRYIWIPVPTPAKIAAVNYTVNIACSQSVMIVKPTVIGGGQLLRWDLRRLAPDPADMNRLMGLWEQFQFEPYFHITKNQRDALPVNAVAVPPRHGDPIGTIRFKIGDELWFKFPNGKLFIRSGNVWVKSDNPFLKINSKISTYGSHCGIQQSVLLQGLMHTNASVVRYDYFITKALSTLDGGLYYDFVGIERNPVGKTAQDAFLESLGANEEVIRKLRSDQRVAMFRSNVTGKPRRIDTFQGSGIRPGSGTGLITITYDLADENVDPATDPIRNLLDFKDDAREVIAERPNGLHIFALFAGDGSLQDSAPDNIVKDHTIPAPHTARLQSAISCIRCHGPHDGLQPFDNDVQKMLSGLLDVFGDNKSKGTIPDTLDRLAGLYAGDLAKPINRSKDDYSDAVFKATDGMTVSAISSAVSDIYADYNYKLVDAVKACEELGFDVPESQSIALIAELLPPLQQDEIGISPEDPVIGALKAGLKVNRYQWEQVYGDAALRSKHAVISNIRDSKFSISK